MKSYNIYSLIIRIIVVLLGTMVAGFGVHLMLVSTLGMDAFSTLVDGVGVYVPIRFGTLCQIFNILFLIADFFLDKRQIGIATVIYGLGCGQFVNIFSDLNLSYGPTPTILLLVIGVYLLGAGVAIYLFADLGSGPIEGVMIALQSIMKLDMKYTRIIIDVNEVIIGILLGGIWGIGTIIASVGTGPSIGFTLGFLQKHFTLPCLRKEESTSFF